MIIQNITHNHRNVDTEYRVAPGMVQDNYGRNAADLVDGLNVQW